jgi:uncharacterized protein
MILGVLSDTHGLLRPEVLPLLAGSDRILHLGDVGDPAILRHLEEIAPVTAVRGNVDRGPGLSTLPLTTVCSVEGVDLYLIHILAELDLDPGAAGMAAVLSGHTHRPEVRRSADGVLYLNPGSCGPRRFDLPVTLARLRVADGRVEGEILPVPVNPSTRR